MKTNYFRMNRINFLFSLTALLLLSCISHAQLKMLSSGNVGIGNLNPTCLLDVGTVATTNFARISAAKVGYIGQSGAGFSFYVNDLTGYALLQTSTNTYINAKASNALVFRVGNTNYGSWTTTGLTVGGVAGTHTLGLFTDDAHKTTTSVWDYGSDLRMKENILPYNQGLDLVRKVRLVSYQYNGLGSSIKGEKGVGVIAQELQDIFPNSVKSHIVKDDSAMTTESFLSVNLHELFISNVRAVQELDSIVNNQSALLLVQDSTIKAQSSMMDALKTLISSCCLNSMQGMKTINDSDNLNETENSIGTGIIENKLGTTSTSTPILYQNNPNPFNQQTSIKYFIPSNAQSASIMVFDLQGKLVKTVPISSFENGAITINGNELNAGMFVYSLIVDGKIVNTKNMILTQ